ncbi:hypothetical protein BS50DRAFT_351331 [Corynespora cassiicola Philippines]|uniref:C2H2-domain containing protein first zinc finger domain-containing protein n=1 Tax=Corynespora cassiicola Philippines TaxID=1448308 RepID=A0A2T2NR70_CORCC|nr:hypothetical protein BS50DRAFT_351331 [Corynespora cassiicola Philippines]
MPIPEGVLNLERPQYQDDYQNFSVPYDTAMQKRAQYRCLYAACKGKPFGRSYELIRHNKEQHLCPHEDCKDIEFASAQEKKEHEKRCHKTDFRCGTCLLKDLHAVCNYHPATIALSPNDYSRERERGGGKYPNMLIMLTCTVVPRSLSGELTN